MADLIEEIEKDAAEVGKLARLVVAQRVAIVGALAVMLQVLVSYHIITPEVSSHVNEWIKYGIDGLAAVAAVLYAQKGVTPTKDPRNDTGTSLIPVSQALALAENAVHKATVTDADAVADDTAELPAAEPAKEQSAE